MAEAPESKERSNPERKTRIVSDLIESFVGKNSILSVGLRDARFLRQFSWLAISTLAMASCSEPEQPRASYAPIAQIEQSFGRLVATANMPTPNQNGTGDRLGLFMDNTGTIWGIPLMYDEHGNLLGCAPPTLREAPITDKIPEGAPDIVGAYNEPTSWRGGTGSLELIFRDAQGTLRWQPLTGGDLKSGPICWAQTPPVQPLKYYRIARTDAK